MDENKRSHDDPDRPGYRRPEEIGSAEIRNGLKKLQLFWDDPFLRVQAWNLELVDQFIMGLEYDLLSKLHEEERTPVPDSMFVLAQSQMWIFGAYELMRTWRQRAREVVKWSDNSGLESKLKVLEKEQAFLHFGKQFRAEQIRRVLADHSIVDAIRADLRLTHILFARIEAVRVALAKHEVRGRAGSVALMPGHGRINEWCGSLDFQLENGAYILGNISRRDIADGIRALGTSDTPPTGESIREFDEFMRGPLGEPPF